MSLAKTFTMNPGWPLIFKDLGLNIPQTLRRAKLPENVFAQLPTQFEPEEFYRLAEAMDTELGDKELALAMAETVNPEVFSPPLFTTICSSNLKTAVKRMSVYKPLVGPIDLFVSETSETFSIRIELPKHHNVPMSVYMVEVMFWVYIVRHCTREHIIPLRVILPKLPNNEKAYEIVLGRKLEVGASAVVIFSNRDAEKSFLTRNDMTWSIFKPEIQKQLHELQANAGISAQVRSVLFDAIPSGHANIDFVADKLRMSTRSLQRKLKEEGESFKSVLTAKRRELALHYLKDTHIPVPETAFLLGYQDTTSFYRAFKSWTGMTPDAFRMAT